MNYEEAVAYIEETPKFTKKNSLEHTKECLRRLGNPQEKFKVIHVAGTNGKGSTCAFLTSILREAGYSCGLFTSPLLVMINDRFQINEVILDNALDTVHRAKNGIDCRFFEGFPEHAHQRSVYGTGRTAGLSNSNIHTKISFFCGKSHCIPENILKWRSFLLYPIFVALSTFYRKYAESVAVGKPVVQRK